MPAPRPAAARPARSPLPVWRLAALWCLLVAPFAWWGLPSSRDDARLFGDQPPWPAERYQLEQTLDTRRTRTAGADTDLDPLAGDHHELVDLTATPADRAAILRRYRLFTRQPDEMITLMALQRMAPRALDFDPRLYQYGGAWIYLVAAGEALAALVGYVELADTARYLQQPETFARFYVVARFVSLLAAGLLLAAVGRITTTLAGPLAGATAMLLTALSPVLISGAVEAKPHVASSAAALWATWFALHFAGRTGAGLTAAQRPTPVWPLGLTAGLSLGFVLTGAATAMLWPAIWLARPAGDRRARPLLRAAAIALATYALTNPYVLLNALAGDSGLGSNIGNSTAMYAVGRVFAGAARVATLFAGNGWLFAIAGVVAAALLLATRRRLALLLLAPAAALLLLLAAIGAGKPAEFGRFLVLPVAAAAITIGINVGALARLHRGAALAAAFLLAIGMNPAPTVAALWTDSRGDHEPRRAAADWLLTRMRPGDRVAVVQEPAPYAIPPLDFTTRSLVLLPDQPPAGPPELPEWLVLTADSRAHAESGWWMAHYRLAWSAPAASEHLITWAAKPTFVLQRQAPQ